MQKEVVSNHSINDPTLLKRKENANDCMTSTKNNSSKELKNSTARLALKQAGGSGKSRMESCRQLLHRRQTAIKPIGRRAVGILSSLQGLTICVFFLRVRTGFGCLEKNPQPTDGGCEQYTHKYSTHRVAQHDPISSRVAQAAMLRIAHLCVLKIIVTHVSCLVLCRT